MAKRYRHVATLTMDGHRWRGVFPRGHAWSVKVIEVTEREAVPERDLIALVLEFACRCGRRWTEIVKTPYCLAFLDPAGGPKVLETILADAYDEHFAQRGPSLFRDRPWHS